MTFWGGRRGVRVSGCGRGLEYDKGKGTVRMGAGTTVRELYELAEHEGFTAVGGESGSRGGISLVGGMGRWCGGGVIRLWGDLFWAVRGGGGGRTW